MAKKSLGQHWLHDERILQAIVEAGNVTSDDIVLEIGPGKGTLTKQLLTTGAQVVALEFDQDLIPELERLARSDQHLEVIEGDIRSFDFSTLPRSYKIIANIPYYLTSNLVRQISETVNPPQTAVLLIQKEVAERICAKPGSMGILSVTAQFYFECILDIEVPAKFFSPPPKVDSQVVVLQKRYEKPFELDENEFFRFVKAGFGEKRKTLRNALSGGLQLPKKSVETMIKQVNLPETVRAQELSLQQWYALYLEYAKL
jgi:16S rRNA (adenine1518-N6/adenine1519-N6)-dimethyltransferase